MTRLDVIVSLLLASIDDCIHRYVRLFTSHLHLFKRINNPTIPARRYSSLSRSSGPSLHSPLPGTRKKEPGSQPWDRKVVPSKFRVCLVTLPRLPTLFHLQLRPFICRGSRGVVNDLRMRRWYPYVRWSPFDDNPGNSDLAISSRESARREYRSVIRFYFTRKLTPRFFTSLEVSKVFF